MSDSYSDNALAAMIPGFTNYYKEINGLTLHYVEGGQGTPLILLPGWPETWWAYHKLMPLLTSKYRVITLDLRGMGSSGKPADGYDKKSMAADVYKLIQQLGIEKAHICGHDIGAHVAYSFAANYPEATGKLIMLDTPHPDETMYQLPMLPIPGLDYTYPWWVAFNQVKALPETLLEGRMSEVIDWVFNALLQQKDSITSFDKAVYSQTYNSREGIRASNAWYQAFNQDIKDIRAYTQVSTTVLGIACNSSYNMLEGFLQKYCTDFKMKRVEDSGHFIVAEQPTAVAGAIISFLETSPLPH